MVKKLKNLDLKYVALCLVILAVIVCALRGVPASVDVKTHDKDGSYSSAQIRLGEGAFEPAAKPEAAPKGKGVAKKTR